MLTVIQQAADVTLAATRDARLRAYGVPPHHDLQEQTLKVLELIAKQRYDG